MKQPNIIKPKSPSEFQIKPERYSVSFYELQNTTAMKTNSIVSGSVLDKDRIYRIYVKVNYTNKEAYNRWILYTRLSIICGVPIMFNAASYLQEKGFRMPKILKAYQMQE